MSVVRLFVAITLADDVRAAVADAQQGARRVLDGSALTWTRPEQLHVTLAFLGEQDDGRASRVMTMMSEDLACAPFEMSLGALGMFPPRGAPRVLWLGLATGADAVTALQRAVVDRLAWLDREDEGRSFHPHITLGRWRAARLRERHRIEALTSARMTPAGMRVEQVTTYRSRLSPSGAVHTPVAYATLAAN